ncbi:hypothetical protein FRC09_005006 [Ceratobasidium sp. 395]|nr:hypothetical protein FRC09_005006 [Ceratobasidium sp. 395]
MSARKTVHEIDPESLPASRTRRTNAGVPRLAFDAVNERLEARTKKANKDAKASAAAAIEGNPLTGDDSPERDLLTKFVAPAETGDPEHDQATYDKARTNYLVRFLATRDGLDVRSRVDSGELDLADLEEMLEDPDGTAEAEYDEALKATDKGKSTATTQMDGQGEGDDDELFGNTQYEGITIDTSDRVVKAKHAPKGPPVTQKSTSGGKKRGAEQDEGSRKIHRGAPGAPHTKPGLRIVSTSTSGAPLSRTDSTTLVDGRPLVHPNFSREATPAASNPSRTSPKGSSSKKNTAQTTAPKHPPPKTPKTPKAQTTRHVASPSVPQAPTASARPNTTRNPACPPVPAQQGQPLEQNQNRNNPEVEAGEDDVDELQDEEVEPTGKKQGTGKAYIISFPEHQRATLTTMARIARARSMANGTYNDNEEVMRAKYPDWPVEEWGARESRHFIVMDSLRMACEEHETNIPFIYRHIQCVNILITSNRTLATKSLKALVDQFFKFTIEKSERNKLLSEKLLPFNFHYKDIRNKRGPFENVLLKFACQLVAFDKLSSIGAKYSEYYKGLPPPFLAYVCALLHFVIFSYRSGKFSKEDLKSSVRAKDADELWARAVSIEIGRNAIQGRRIGPPLRARLRTLHQQHHKVRTDQHGTHELVLCSTQHAEGDTWHGEAGEMGQGAVVVRTLQNAVRTSKVLTARWACSFASTPARSTKAMITPDRERVFCEAVLGTAVEVAGVAKVDARAARQSWCTAERRCDAVSAQISS